jgi:hypothetical protein
MAETRNTYFNSENLKGRDYLEDLNVDGSVFLNWILKEFGGRINRINVAQDRDQ